MDAARAAATVPGTAWPPAGVAAARVDRRGPVPGPGGLPWRDVPTRYGPWWRMYAPFSCWPPRGIWTQVEQALIAHADAVGKVTWQVSVDSTTARPSARAHVHAAGARRDSGDRIGEEPTIPGHALGRSRGGWSTKLHLAVEHQRHVLCFLLTPG